MFRVYYSHLLIVCGIFGLIQCNQFIAGSLDSVVNPNFISANCTFGSVCSGSVNSTIIHYYSVLYTYVPNNTIQIETKMNYSSDQTDPVLVVVRQVRGIISWTLPYIFTNGMIYTNVSRILCPQNEDDMPDEHSSIIFVEISTSNPGLIDYSIQLQNVSHYVLLQNSQHTFDVSPSMPVYYKVFFPPGSSNIFIQASSSDKLCSTVSVQSYSCPVYDVGAVGIGQGHYQTMSTSASFNVYSSEFAEKNQFLLVFLVKTTDTDCLDVKKSADIIPAGLVDVKRTKTITISIPSPRKLNYLIIAMVLTAIIFLSMFLIAFIIMWRCSDVYTQMDPETIPLEASEHERELQNRARRESLEQTSQGEDNVIETRPQDFARQASTIEIIGTSNPGVVSVTDLSVIDYDDLRKQFRIYPTTMTTVAIFYSLPVIQLVLQYQINIDASGNEDLCYFNFLCTRELFRLTAFNNILSNIGYTALGILFFIIVYRRDGAYSKFVIKHPEMAKERGIPQHFGLFYAMAIGLMMEGVMSACYHVCPSRQNFQFDTSFMFIIAVLNLIKIYQIRHADIHPNSSRTFFFLATIIFITVIGVYFDKLWFWISYALLHILICVIFTAKIYYMGGLKISTRFFIHLCRHLKHNRFLSRPRYINRMVLLILGNCLNIAFALYGAIFQPESFPNHLLFVFLGNLALYLIYYIVMKGIHKEHFTGYAIVLLILSFVSWIPSLYFFYNEVKSYEVQPATSRSLNQPCILFDTYDAHDVWHLLSSFALFFSFLSLLTIDDGVRMKRREELAAF